MLTWQLDRLLRSGPLCALASALLPAAMAFIVAAVSDIENVLGILLVASALMGIGSIVGSVVAVGLGVALFGLGSTVAEVPAALLAGVGIGLYAVMVIHDLSGAFHRAPRINPALWRNAATTIAMIGGASIVTFAVTYFVATRATWQSIVVPFGIAAVGFGAKLAADSHAEAARALTRRTPDPQATE